MYRTLVFSVVMGLASLASAAEFSGTFNGFVDGKADMNGRAYPVKPDIVVGYRGGLVAIDRVPSGTHVVYRIENYNGVGTLMRMTIPETSPELDELFPAH